MVRGSRLAAGLRERMGLLERSRAEATGAERPRSVFSAADLGWAAGIFLLALTVRLVYLSDWIESPYYDCPLLDEQYHHDWALEMARGEPGEAKPYFRAPLYPWCLGLIYRVFGAGPLAPRVAQALLGSFSAVLLFLLGRRVFGRAAGGAAGLVAGAYPVLVFFDGELLIAPLEVFLDLVFALALLGAWNTQRPGRWAAAGLAGGLSAIARPNILLPMGVLGVWALWRWRRAADRRRGLTAIGAFILGACAAILPVTIRNRVVGGDWVLIASQGGINAYLGNGPTADGFVPRSDRLYSRFEGYEDTVELFARHEAERAVGRPLWPSEVSRYWTRQTLACITADPLRWIGLMARKSIAFWTRVEIRNNKNIAFALQFSPPLSALRRVLNFGLVGPFALVGLIWAWRAVPAAAPIVVLVLVYAASMVLFFVCDRFRAPLLPYFILSGMWAAGRMAALARRREFASLRRPLLGLAVAAALVNIDWFGLSAQPRAEDEWMLSVCYDRKGETEAAREALERAVAEDSSHYHALHNLGNLALREGDSDKALDYYRRAIEAFPAFATAYNSVGAVLAARGETEPARRAFEKCLELDPFHALAHVNLGELLRREGKLDQARAEFERAAELAPSQAGPCLGLARVEAAAGRREEAARWAAKALQVGGEPARAAIKADESLKGLETKDPEPEQEKNAELGTINDGYLDRRQKEALGEETHRQTTNDHGISNATVTP